MVRVGLSVEGSTEERFVKLVLVPYFSQYEIYITPIQLFGNISIERVMGEIEKLSYSFDYVSTFYDFYGFKRKIENETKESLEKRIVDSLPKNIRQKFIPYIQMYEFEGLLFSSPSIMASHLQGIAIEKWALNILIEFENNPEKINNLKETAPSKRLEKHTNYKKTQHGPDIAKEAGLIIIRKMCSGFDAWLKKLEALRSHHML